MATRKCCHTGNRVGRAVVRLDDGTERQFQWCERHLEWAREAFLLLLARSAFPGSQEVTTTERLFTQDG